MSGYVLSFIFVKKKVIRYPLTPFPTLRQKFNACSPLYMDCKFGFSVTDFLSQNSSGKIHNVVLFITWWG